MAIQQLEHYPFKKHLRLLSIFTPSVLFLCGIVLGIFAIALFQQRETASSQQSFADLVLSILRFIIPLFSALMIILAGILVFVQVLPNFLSYLKVSEQGLEYNYWPSYHIRCSWDDAQTITKRREVVMADVILLRHATELGHPTTMTMRRKLGMDTQYFIPLNVLEGWPTGKLADTLKQHAPRLFESKADANEG